MTQQQTREKRSLQYRITPSPDAKRLIDQIVAEGFPRSIVESAIIKRDTELSARVAYS
jgi:hypothetical protein